ncbi:MAG: peptidoglycan editing factor PgeF [Candidatus Marinarcus sp.]|uniref:peptidoglycan editing factor PgeF n=1 Tax=Candidatus Marinarcus sp. TaxID=3100987 RepID=UPI003B00F568
MKIKQFFTTKDDGNIAFHVTTDHASVEKNRQALAQTYGIDLSSMHYMEQTHGNNVEIITKDSPLLTKDCDALITNEPNIALMVMVADCIPILLKDEVKGVIAVVHAGRNSTFLKIAQITVEKMMEQYGCKSKDIEAILGPSIQKCCYEVSSELALIVKNSFSDKFVNHRHIDLQGINKMLLEKMKIGRIEISTVCTKCSNKNYFSYRLDKNCGRFAAISVIK